MNCDWKIEAWVRIYAGLCSNPNLVRTDRRVHATNEAMGVLLNMVAPPGAPGTSTPPNETTPVPAPDTDVEDGRPASPSLEEGASGEPDRNSWSVRRVDPLPERPTADADADPAEPTDGAPTA